jgi:predicted acetyltransferase
MEIRKIVEKDLKDFYRIQRNAYPAFGINNFEDFKKKTLKTQTEDPKVNNYGVFEANDLVGGMKLHDFEMNYFGQKFTAGGIGGIAVDLLHKKEKICKTLMEFYHAQYKDAPFLILYPFRPDFYQKMGFGFGTNMHYYHAKPSAFPNYRKKSHLQFLSIADLDELLAFYNFYASKKHGLLQKNKFEFEGFLKSPNMRVVAYKKDGKMLGYMCFSFRKKHKGNSLVNDLIVYEHAWETKEVFAEFMTFLHCQNDQVERVFYPTFNNDFYHVLADVRYSSGNLHPPVYHESYMGSVGLMYKVRKAKEIILSLPEHNFGGAYCRVRFVVEDSLTDHTQDFSLEFIKGIARETTDYDVEVKMEIAEFSSLFVGSLQFKNAYFYGKAQISDENYISEINKIFANQKNPQNLTWF